MEALNLITFCSAFQGQTADAVRRNHTELLGTMSGAYDVRICMCGSDDTIDYSTYAEGAPTLVFIASGGTEGMAVRHFSELPKPLVLLTDGKANSLAASMELSCWVRQHGEQCSILHDEAETIVQSLKEMLSQTFSPLAGKRIGAVGNPSEWLVSSDVDYAAARKRWGVEYVDIPLERVNTYYGEVTDEEVQADVKAFVACAVSMKEATHEDVVKAMRLYRALRRIVDEEQLDAITVKCFDLIPTTGTTGCLALARLNDEDVPAGCEGDLQSVFTMLLCKQLTEEDTFMANPSWVREHEALFAHCTIGLQQVDKYIIRSHFESGIGVAIQGLLPQNQTVTVVKFGGKGLDKYMAVKAQLIENQDDPRKCRTQILLQTDDNVLSHYLLSSSIGNHHIILHGDHTAAINHLAEKMGLMKMA